MKTSKFKTNAKCAGCLTKIGAELGKKLKPDQWSIDLSSPDKVLVVNSSLDDAEIIGMVEAAGFKATHL